MRLRKLYEHPIFIQLVVFTVLIGIVPLILISGFVFYKMADMAREEVMDSHEQVILQYTDGVEEKLRQYQESVIQIANNTIILKTLAAGGFRRLYARQESQQRKLSNHSCWNEKPRSTAAWSILRSPKTRSTDSARAC